MKPILVPICLLPPSISENPNSIEGVCCSAHIANLSKGKELHTYMLKNGFLASPLAITSLINMYSKCTLMNHALKVFNFPTHHDNNVFAYKAIIAGFVANGLCQHGFRLYKKMRLMGIIPDKYTFPCVIRACGVVVEDLEANKIHGLELDVFVGSALVNPYLKFGLVVEAHKVFDELPVRDVVLWNSMVNGYGQIGYSYCSAASTHLEASMHGREIHWYMTVNGLRNDGSNSNFDYVLLNNALMDMYAANSFNGVRVFSC